jgi:hypothetical protein
MRPNPKPPVPDVEEAEELALDVLIWLGRKLDLMQRFLALSGIPADSIRDHIGHLKFYAGLLAFVLGNERDLLDFCAEKKVDPAWFVLCYEKFAGEGVPWA